MAEILLEIKKMSKNFGPIVALKEVDLTVRRGEIHGLIGENGSGKSTITSIAAGMQPASSGEMFFKGQPWKPDSMVHAQAQGMSMILQEANTIPNCTVAENLFAGQEDRFSRFGFVNARKMNREADALLAKFGLKHIHGRDNINNYGFEDRKLVEIARAVTDETEILVVDETTTALSFEGREILYKLMHDMAAKGKAIIFISHDMDEILQQCTVLTVLRDGEIRGTLNREQMTAPGAVSEIRKLMVGRDIGDKFYRSDYDPSCSDEVVLSFEQVTTAQIKDFNLEIHAGEIVGLGGLSGCGMHEIGRLAFGVGDIDSGHVKLRGEDIKDSVDAVGKGIGYISKNRDLEAVILEAPIGVNIVQPSLRDLGKNVFIRPSEERKMTREQIDLLAIKCANGSQWVNTLSGGNKQKVSFAKWIAKGSSFIIMDCPTRGVDIGVKQAMYQLITDMKRESKAILMISEELAELIGMADRMIIMKDFQVAKEFTRSPELTEADIIEYMI
ncbi:MAG: sugar ABC transporter ATP-binding protein [Oscillospiraceae bacterium]|nr:sugar ABC transporter ATP-binding protein [Oscillospiraceae bacterium]